MVADVVVVGAGIVGAACAYYCAAAGLRVTVVDRGSVAGGTTGAGEGNVLVSDKGPGPELDLALWSGRLWRELAAPDFEYEAKGGLVVASSEDELAALRRFADGQRAAGVVVEPVTDLIAREPDLNPELVGGCFYSQDAQVQPMLAAAHLLARSGATVRSGVEVYEVTPHGVRTGAGDIPAGAVVNATGAWAGLLADLPIAPRRGFVLVTEPLPPRVRHKVYAAGYVADVAAGDGDLRTSPVVEGTRSGTILIGSTRETVGFDRTPSLPAIRALARGAIALFPFLAHVNALRAYCGFRPYSPDHLPVIGPDRHRPGLWHACGHEGAGIGLAPATGAMIAALLTGGTPDVDPTPFRPDRFVA